MQQIYPERGAIKLKAKDLNYLIYNLNDQNSDNQTQSLASKSQTNVQNNQINNDNDIVDYTQFEDIQADKVQKYVKSIHNKKIFKRISTTQSSLSTYSKNGRLMKVKLSKMYNGKNYYCRLENCVFQAFETENSDDYKIYIDFNQIGAYIQVNYNLPIYLKYQFMMIVEKLLKAFILHLLIYQNGNSALFNKQNIPKVIFLDLNRNYQNILNFGKQSINQSLFLQNRIISSTQFLDLADNFDIVLFATANIPGSLQRFFTNSNYGYNNQFDQYLDHIGIVLKAQGETYLFESTSQDGVQISNWKSFSTQEWYKSYSRIAFRKLDGPKSVEMIHRFHQFVQTNRNLKYEISLGKLLQRTSVMTGSQNTQNNQPRTYFCSELVAKVLKHVGLLANEKSSTRFWPSENDFAGDIKLELKARYQREILIDFQL